MQMYYFRGNPPNFGDELNPWLWPKLFGNIWHDDDPEIFLGVGSILYGDRFPADRPKIVFGAGYGGYSGGPPDVHDNSWDIFFVRGPQSAEWLGIDSKLALTDAAILVRTLPLPPPTVTARVAFMPHFESLDRGNWQQVCAAAGILLIDPRQPVETVLGQIRGSGLVLTEAMHGAIVADALRVPWIALRPIVSQHRFKWIDWTRSINVPYAPVPTPPSSLREAWISANIGEAKGRFSQSLAAGAIGRLTDSILIERGARQLLHIASRRPSLSSDATIAALTDRTGEMVETFKRKFNHAPRSKHIAVGAAR